MGKLLFIFSQAEGHLNVLKSIGKLLLYKYPEHEVYFCVNEDFDKKVKNACPKFKTFICKLRSNPEREKYFREQFSKKFFLTGKERYHANLVTIDMIQDFLLDPENQKSYEEVINNLKPDFILIDHLFNLPFVENKPIKWGMVVSANALYANSNVEDFKLPPSMSGLSVFEDKKLYEEYYELYKQSNVVKKRNQWYRECGVDLENEHQSLIKGSNYANLFVFPKFARYFEADSLDGKWFSASSAILADEIEAKMQQPNEKKIKHPGKDLLTEDFLKLPGKLILFSLGTLVTLHEEIMTNCIEILSRLKHKFIVTGGPNSDKFKVPNNCKIAKYLDFLELLPIVDIVCSHGGNNSFAEIFHYNSKPCIIVPAFGDQPDTAARVNDLNIGVAIQLGEFNEETFSDAITKVSSDQNMANRMIVAGKQSREDRGLDEFVDELNLHLKK